MKEREAMTERERLKKLLAECINEPEKTCPMPEETTCDGCKYDMVHGGCDMIGRYADHLLANGVIVLPCNIGEALYFPMRQQVIQYRVTMIRVREEGVKITCTNDEAFLQMTIDEDRIGKTIFRNYEEAEKAAGIRRNT